MKVLIYAILIIVSACSNKTTLYYSKKTIEGEEVLLDMKPPEYTLKQRYHGIEGWVIVEYDINENGKVERPVVIDEYPPNEFSKAAVKSVLSYRYKPAVKNGQAIRVVGTKAKVTFKMEKDLPVKELNCENARHLSANVDCRKIE
ncbi:MAG: energy transducer TonB [Moraxellaceae bacterium]|nr:energy transducer TonB [Moraxellaceae bacterium]